MKHLVKQTTILTISGIITKALTLLFFVILARSLSVPEYGLFRYLLTIAAMYAITFTGIHLAMSKKISEKKASSYTITTNSLVISIITFMFLSLVIVIFQENALILILFLFAALVDSFYLGFIRGILDYVKLSGFKILENMIQLLVLSVIFLSYRRVSFLSAVIFYSLSGILSLMVFEFFRRELVFGWHLSRRIAKDLISYAVPVMIGSVGWTIMFGVNAIFIKQFYGTEQVGFYSIAETVVQVFTFLPAAITTILLPKSSALKNKTAILKPLKAAVLATIFTSLMMLAVLIFFARQIITFVFSQKYAPASPVVAILGVAVIMISIHNIYATLFQGFGKPIIPSLTISSAAVLNIIGSHFLTRNYGIEGAALSLAITSSIALIIIVVIFQLKWKTLSKT